MNVFRLPKDNIPSAHSSPLLLELTLERKAVAFGASILSAREQAEFELQALDETIESVKWLKPDCDKLDYILAASAGALCGILDIFFVGKPGQSAFENITDKWFSEKTQTFAKLCGWKGEGEKSAIRFLEQKFKIPYDQRGRGDAASFVSGLSPSNHHFKSLAHNPTLCGLFFAVLDQFNNTSHFVSGGQLIALEKADDTFELKGTDVPSKFFCAFVNWFGHLISDMSGSSAGKGRGMGIPSPLWAWTNDIIAVKESLHIPTSWFDEAANELALKIYENGYDARFQAVQAIPVLINEMIVRMIYSVRRLLRYFSGIKKGEYSARQMWRVCEPFSNPTVKRMLTVAHGTFCVLDIGDAAVRGFVKGGGAFDLSECILRLNIVGIGRLTVSLYGEGKRAFTYRKTKDEATFAAKEKVILENYMEGLNLLAHRYGDRELLTFVQDLRSSELYRTSFYKTVQLAELRNVPDQKILRSKRDVDSYFGKG